jgi:hypothetical protein
MVTDILLKGQATPAAGMLTLHVDRENRDQNTGGRGPTRSQPVHTSGSEYSDARRSSNVGRRR